MHSPGMAILLLAVLGGGILARGDTSDSAIRPIRVRSRRIEGSLPLSQTEFVTPTRGDILDPFTARRCLFLLAMAAVVVTALAYRSRTARLRIRERELIAEVERSTHEAIAAQQSNRAKDRFLAILSHELRTPLTPVLLSVGSLLEETEIAPEIREDLEMIRRNIELEAQLLDDLFDLSRIERGLFRLKLERVDIHQVIRRAREICSAAISEAGLKVVEDFAAEEHHVQGDSARLIQIFWNLFRNAARFATPGATLTIRSFHIDDGLAAAASVSGPTAGEVSGESLESVAGARNLVVEFQDTGIGIAPEWLERIFDPFRTRGQRAPAAGERTGLGPCDRPSSGPSSWRPADGLEPGPGPGCDIPPGTDHRAGAGIVVATRPGGVVPRPDKIRTDAHSWREPRPMKPMRTSLGFLVFTTSVFSLVFFILSHPAYADDPSPALTRERASAFARLALKGLSQEYPNKPEHVVGGPSDVKGPKALHPAFFGCYDWHSSVHGHWMLVRLLRRFPDLLKAKEIRSALGEHLTAENLKAEADYFARPGSQSFERTYGWAWLLKLAEELRGWDDPDAKTWVLNLKPLADVVVARYRDFFPKQTYPIRTGVHPNTAFGLSFAYDYARAVGDTRLRGLIEERARATSARMWTSRPVGSRAVRTSSRRA